MTSWRWTFDWELGGSGGASLLVVRVGLLLPLLVPLLGVLSWGLSGGWFSFCSDLDWR